MVSTDKLGYFSFHKRLKLAKTYNFRGKEGGVQTGTIPISSHISWKCLVRKKCFKQCKVFFQHFLSIIIHFRNAETFHFHFITRQCFAIRQNFSIHSSLKRGNEAKILKSEYFIYGYTKHLEFPLYHFLSWQLIQEIPYFAPAAQHRLWERCNLCTQSLCWSFELNMESKGLLTPLPGVISPHLEHSQQTTNTGVSTNTP